MSIGRQKGGDRETHCCSREGVEAHGWGGTGSWSRLRDGVEGMIGGTLCASNSVLLMLEHRNGVEDPRCRLGMKGAEGVECDTVNGDVVFAGTWIIDVGCKTIDVGNIFADVRDINMSCKAIDGGNVFAGACVVDVGCKAIDEDHSCDTGLEGNAQRP